MKLYSNKHEIRAILTILDSPEPVSAFLLGKLKNSFFGYDPAKEVYKRLMNLLKSGKKLPSRDLLKDDPALSEAARNLLASTMEPLDNGDHAAMLLKVLSDYRRIRSIHNGVSEITELFKNDDVESSVLDEAVRMLDSHVKDALVSDDANEIRTVGFGSNSKKMIDRILDPTRKKFIPTGIPAFDNRNGGWSRGSLITLAANSGGGKSVLALQLAVNMFRAGHKVAYVSMEMSEEEVYERLVSNISGIEFTKVLLKKVSMQQEKVIRKAWKKFDRVPAEGEDGSDKFFKIWVPTTSVSLSNVINTLAPFKPDVVFVDMINLLEPEDKKVQQQAQQLGDMTRYGKIAANSLGIVLVLLAQLNEEDKVKYSRAIVENSNNVWTWFLGEKEKETHFFTVKQSKARNQETFDIPMVEDLAHMSISGRDPEEETTESTTGSDEENA